MELATQSLVMPCVPFESSYVTPPSTPPNKSNQLDDGSGIRALPTVDGLHRDMPNIAPDVLAELIRGNYGHLVDKFTVIDCRYPYEYEGGHVFGAINLYNESLMDKFVESTNGPARDPRYNQRHVLIFYCEFSRQRSPTLLRYLRHLDRTRNLHLFPKLDYPEVYILNGGYEKFYENFGFLCSPQGYIRMDDPVYDDQLDKFWVNKKYTNKDRTKRRVLGHGFSRTLTF